MSETPRKDAEIPCAECGGLVVEFSVTNDTWNKVIRLGGREHDKEYLCVQCFANQLELSLRAAEARVREGCARVCESRAGSGSYAESMGAYRILTSAAAAIRSLDLSTINAATRAERFAADCEGYAAPSPAMPEEPDHLTISRMTWHEWLSFSRRIRAFAQAATERADRLKAENDRLIELSQWWGNEHCAKVDELVAMSLRADRLQAENERLRKLEHAAWHAFDDSEEIAQGVYQLSGNDLQELLQLLPEQHPKNAPQMNWMGDAAIDAARKEGSKATRQVDQLRELIEKIESAADDGSEGLPWTQDEIDLILHALLGLSTINAAPQAGLDSRRLDWLDHHCAFVADPEYKIGPFGVGELRQLADAGLAQDWVEAKTHATPEESNFNATYDQNARRRGQYDEGESNV